MQEHQANAQERIWLTYAAAEQHTALDRTTIWRAVRRGDLRVGGVGRAPRFHVGDLDDFMRGRAPARAPKP